MWWDFEDITNYFQWIEKKESDLKNDLKSAPFKEEHIETHRRRDDSEMDERKGNDASAKKKEKNGNVEDWSKTTVTLGKEYEKRKRKKNWFCRRKLSKLKNFEAIFWQGTVT